jgi:hypothetical protein
MSIAVLAFLSSSPGQAQSPFYKGKTILAGTGAGNVYDIFARLFVAEAEPLPKRWVAKLFFKEVYDGTKNTFV